MNAIARSREEQFQRELHIRQIAGANRGAADRKAARAHFESARRAQKVVATRRLKHTAAPAAAPSGPRDLFDATATIGITAAVAKEVATERAERMRQAGNEHSVSENQSIISDAIAELAAAAAAGSPERADAAPSAAARARGGVDGGDLTPGVRAPQSAEELRQEVEWLRRKAEGAREDCRQAESAARERAAARQRPLTLEELNADLSLIHI